MGVLACSRSCCTNIMCDRYSCEYGYLCDECFEELVSRGIIDIESFFNEDKKNKFNRFDAIEAYYNEIFRKRNGEN